MAWSKPTLIFVHGAWHRPEYFTKTITALEQEGYHCIAPQLQMCGTPEPVSSLASTISQVQDIIVAEITNGNDVVMVNHSFGGIVGCSAVKGFTAKDSSKLGTAKGKVVGIIELCAFMVPSNTDLNELVASGPGGFRVHVSSDGWVIVDDDTIEVFYNDLPAEKAQHWQSRLVNQSAATFSDRDSIYAGWADVPVWYLHCTEDKAMNLLEQEAMVAGAKQAGASVTTKTLQHAGHSPFLSRVDETVEFIREACQNFA
ncbi:uncharacterized protein PFLUO_LOCUS6712 [Penicillium psychrofluorescens]|uniref:uncharacterized protein n=1 Tax=Penicillium psychrofluorescens TaxID=3158075 RepID=UPI003CCDF168